MSDDLEKRLRCPPFGTETSERKLMAAAADEITRLRAELVTARQDAMQEVSEGVLRLGNLPASVIAAVIRAAAKQDREP